MKTRGVTIDQIGMEAHERYALDQVKFDPTFLTESNSVPSHSEIIGISMIYGSKWEELFEINLTYVTWASFAPPPAYRPLQRRRYFQNRLIPSISWFDEDGEEQEGPTPKWEEYKELLMAQENHKVCDTFERQRATLLNLLDSMHELNELIKEVQARKLQYQKG